MKSAFFVFQDDADLYTGLWGKSWSWIWPLAPLALGGLAALATLGLWSLQVSRGLAAAGPWWRIPELLTVLGLFLGLAVGSGSSVLRVMERPWPMTGRQAWGLALAGPFLHPAFFLAMVSGLVAAGPWVQHRTPLFFIGLVFLPVIAFRAGMALMSLAGLLSLPLKLRESRRRDAPGTLNEFFRQMAGGSAQGMAGCLLALPLLLAGHFILGFSALGFGWAMAQADLLRLEGRGSTLVASFPAPVAAKVDARLHGVARWASPSALVAWAALAFRLGPTALLPGGVALLGMHLTGDAIGLWASASAPLVGWSLSSLQSLGLITVLGGTASGWLFAEALRDPMVLLAQVMVALTAWLLLQRVRDQVVADWPSIQENLVQG